MSAQEVICHLLSQSARISIFVVPPSTLPKRNGYWFELKVTRHGSSSSDNSIFVKPNVDDWKIYGKAIQQSSSADSLAISNWRLEGSTPITPYILPWKCLHTFFDSAKRNKSIRTLIFSWPVITSVSPCHLQYFFQMNPSFQHLSLFCANNNTLFTRVHSSHLERSLRNVNRYTIHIESMSFENGCHDLLFRAACMAKKVWIACADTTHIVATSSALGDRNNKWRTLNMNITRESGMSINPLTAETTIISALRTNNQLEEIFVCGYDIEQLFCSKNSIKDCSNLLCNRSSISSIINSNHSLQKIKVQCTLYSSYLNCDRSLKEYLKLNQSHNKNQVVHYKIMHHFFNESTNLDCLNNFSLSIIAVLLGSSAPKKHNAVFNIIKKFPELSNVSDRVNTSNARCVLSQNWGWKKQRTN